MSWPVVGFFYPTLMFCLIAIGPLDRLIPRPYPDFLIGARPRLGLGACSFLAVFSAAQLVPHLMPGDTALTGEGRLFGVHMFDALIQCEAKAVFKTEEGLTEARSLYRPMAARIHCDPIVFWNRARALCRSEARGRRFTDFDLYLNSRRSTEGKLTPVVRLENFCASDPAYRVWRHNAWIMARYGS
jgi:hypothetical protein